MDLTLVYIFIAVIAAVLSFGVVSVDDRNIRRMLLVMLLSTIGVGSYLQTVQYDERIESANQQIVELAQCYGEQRLCSWSTK